MGNWEWGMGNGELGMGNWLKIAKAITTNRKTGILPVCPTQNQIINC